MSYWLSVGMCACHVRIEGAAKYVYRTIYRIPLRDTKPIRRSVREIDVGYG